MNERNYLIRKKEQKDCKGIARVVTISWNETYKGIVHNWFLEELKNNENERSQMSYEIDNNYQLVLEVDNEIVGFVNYGISEDKEFNNCGEIYALSRFTKSFRIQRLEKLSKSNR